MQTTCVSIFCMPEAVSGLNREEMRASNEILRLLMQVYRFVLLNNLPYCTAVSLVCRTPYKTHSLNTLELGAISKAQKANMCADALVPSVIIVIKIQSLGAVEKLTFLLHCVTARH